MSKLIQAIEETAKRHPAVSFREGSLKASETTDIFGNPALTLDCNTIVRYLRGGFEKEDFQGAISDLTAFETELEKQFPGLKIGTALYGGIIVTSKNEADIKAAAEYLRAHPRYVRPADLIAMLTKDLDSLDLVQQRWLQFKRFEKDNFQYVLMIPPNSLQAHTVLNFGRTPQAPYLRFELGVDEPETSLEISLNPSPEVGPVVITYQNLEKLSADTSFMQGLLKACQKLPNLPRLGKDRQLLERILREARESFKVK